MAKRKATKTRTSKSGKASGPHASAPKAPSAAPDFQLLFEQSPDILLVLLPDAPRFTMVGATRSRFDATSTTRDTIGKGLFEVFPDNPDDGEASGTANLRASLERVLKTRAPDTMAVQKYDVRDDQGAFVTRYWSPRNIPVLAADGSVRYILHRVEEVTELVHQDERGEELRDQNRAMKSEVIARSRELATAIDELRRANTALGELDQAKTAFFSNVSHEFRTPLTLMLGPLEDLLSDSAFPLAPGQRERVQLAHASALRLLKLVNALLDFSRIEAGRLRAHFAPTDLCAATLELAGMFESAAQRAGLALIINCPPLSGPVWIDRDLWEKIVSNLISNALKFTFTGKIVVQLKEGAGQVSLSVSDTGVGIPQAELDKVFDRFHRVQGVVGRSHEGSGIGLALVRELVELHGGTVRVRSTIGKGTTFTVEIPKGFAHLPEDAISREAPQPRPATAPSASVAETERWAAAGRPDADRGARNVERHGRGRRSSPPGPPFTPQRSHALVVDDNPDLRRYITELLDSTYRVTTAGDGVEALEQMRVERPDIVLSDVMMPRLDGFGLLRAIRGDPKLATVPVVLLSARAGEESAIEGLDVGADDYLTKPFSARELLARVRTHIKLANARHEFIARLEQVNRELEAFSYSVSHDLKNPLFAVSALSEALQEDYGDRLNHRGNEYVSMIRSSVRQMDQLVEALLGLSQAAQRELRRVEVDVSRLAADVARRLEQRADAAGRKVEIAIDPALTIEGDAGLLTAVFENLMGNAWKFTAKTASARIEIGAEERDGVRAYYVRDNGPGFDASQGQDPFAPFQRLHGKDEFEGHGIGLATVQRIIHRHGGRVWAESELGKGATFWFTVEKA
ncbi:MAG TPA: ATP-binding protein [Gemmatimonadales bacterium]|nr:ATP-binding protein [Gemmatimonadales bacterium]